MNLSSYPAGSGKAGKSPGPRCASDACLNDTHIAPRMNRSATVNHAQARARQAMLALWQASAALCNEGNSMW